MWSVSTLLPQGKDLHCDVRVPTYLGNVHELLQMLGHLKCPCHNSTQAPDTYAVTTQNSGETKFTMTTLSPPGCIQPCFHISKRGGVGVE